MKLMNIENITAILAITFGITFSSIGFSGGVSCKSTHPCCVSGSWLGGDRCNEVLEEIRRKSEAASCTTLEGTFQSINKYERGLGPNGLILDHWLVSFSHDRVTSEFSDISQEGTYACRDLEGTITSDILSSGSAFYMAEHDVLLWNGKWYKKSATAETK
jgi:hypothetical protein